MGAPPRRTGTGRRKGDAASVQSTGQHRMSKRIAVAHVGMHCACFILLLVYPSMNERRKVTDPRTDISFQCGPCVCLHMLLLNPNPVNKYCMLTRALLALLSCSYYQRCMNFLYYCKNPVNFLLLKKIEKTVNSPCSVWRAGPTHGYGAAAYLSQASYRMGGKSLKILN